MGIAGDDVDVFGNLISPNRDVFNATVTVGTDITLRRNTNYYYCDGVADDVQINAAIIAIGVLGGGSLHILEGTYDILSTITPCNNLIIKGSGMGVTVLNVTAAIKAFSILKASPLDNVEIRDLSISITDAPDAGGAIQFIRGTNFRFINLDLYDRSALTTGDTSLLRLGEWTNDANLVTTVNIENVTCRARGLRHTTPITIFWVTDTLITDSKFKGRDVGVDIDAAGPPSVNIQGSVTMLMQNCIVELGHHNGIIWNDGSAAGRQSTDQTISNCIIRDNGDDATDQNNNLRLTVSDCTFTNNQYWIASLEDNCMDCVISNNLCVGQKGVYINTGSIVLIEGNLFRRDDDTLAAINVIASTDVTITNNVIRRYSNSIYVEQACVRVFIEGNKLLVSGYHKTAVRIDDSEQVHVISNYIVGWDVGGAVVRSIYPIWMTGTSDGCTIKYNTFYFHHDSRVIFLGADTKVRHNEIYIGATSQVISFDDMDGTMTGVTGTPFTYQEQKSEYEGLAIDAVAVVTQAVLFPYQYPSGGATNGGSPVVTLTLKDATATFAGTLWVSNVSVTGFTININVTVAAAAANTVDVAWKANLPEKI